MPYIEINQAQIHYQSFGIPDKDRSPILLIHGSTVDGQTDWGVVGPLLGQHHHVIVPDCRGHGRSSNPFLTYSFVEMAEDFAQLIKVLGYNHMHVIGHSNGGNVALCLLLEHPEIVKSCVLQAANAFVSQDLIDREPSIFDPARVATKSPLWMNEMINLHGAVHGSDYWRDLLRITVAEIINAPNYSAKDLSEVTQPVLVIQGEDDTVNNVGKHGQFLAQHIPNAKLWMPEAIGHNVHQEIPLQWLQQINLFIQEVKLIG